MITDRKFTEVISAFLEMYEDGPKSSVAMTMYKSVLDRNFETDEAFEIAAFKLLGERVYPTFPKPAEFVQAVKPKKEDMDSRIAIAVVDIKNAIKNYGAYSSVAFEDYLIHLVIKYGVGSWVKLCKMKSEEIEQFIKWDFPKLYKAYSDRNNLEIPLYLEGSTENRNSQLGHKIPKVVFIGEERKIKNWQDAYVSKNILTTPKNKLQVLGYKIPESVKKIDERVKQMTPEEVFEMHRQTNFKNRN